MPAPGLTPPPRLAPWLGALALAALAGPARGADGDPKIPLEHYRLDNGLEVILHRDDTVPRVYVSVWYRVGSSDEAPGQSGRAHLVEHLMFRGSLNVGAGRERTRTLLRKAGASAADGSTNADRSSFHSEVPTAQLETALWIESDRMAHLAPTLTQDALDELRAVVRSERQGNAATAWSPERQALQRMLFADGHPYRNPILGEQDELAAATVDDVKAFLRTWYVPGNATLFVGGDIDLEATRALVEKWFGSFPRTTRPQRTANPPAPIGAGPRRETVHDEQARWRRLHYAWLSPAAFAPGDAELDILATVLARPGTGRLHKLLVRDKQWAKDVAAFQQGQEWGGVFHVQIDLEPTADVKAVAAALDAELDQVMKQPISERERKRVVTEIEASFVRGLEALGRRGENAQAYNHYLGDPSSFTRHLDFFRNASAEQLQKTAAARLGRDQRVEVLTLPAPSAGAR